MAMIRLPKDFKKFLRLLNGHHVEYLLVGGYAVGYHGYPRATVGLDIWVAVSHRNARELVEAFKEFGFDVVELKEDLFLQENKIIRIGEPPLRIEVMTSVSGVDFAACYHVEGGGKSRRWSAKNCDAELISDLLSVFLSTPNFISSSNGSNWQRRQFLFHSCLAQTVALPVGLDDMTSVG